VSKKKKPHIPVEYNLLAEKDRVQSLMDANKKLDSADSRYWAVVKEHAERTGKPMPSENPFYQKLNKERAENMREIEKGFYDGLHSKGPDYVYRETKSPLEQEILKPDLPKTSKLRLLKHLGPVVGIWAALSAPSADAAVADMMGVESLGVSDEQKALDKRYQEILRERSLKGQ
jgi:hypothetical protein